MKDKEYYLSDLKNSENKLILELEELILVESVNFYKNRNRDIQIFRRFNDGWDIV